MSFRYQLATLLLVCISIATTAQNDTIILTAKQGDGIYSILRNNGFDPTLKANEFILLNKNKLSKSNTLVKGETYVILPQQKEVETLTANYYQPKIIDNSLEGACFYILSGHGGPDPGAIATINNKTICEDEYAYDIALRLAYKIREHGGHAIMIIQDLNDSIRDGKYLLVDKDEVCIPNLEIPLDNNKRLKQRVTAINKLYVANKKKYKHHRVVAIHIDSRKQNNNIDVFFYHSYKSKNGKALAAKLKNTFISQYKKHQPNRTYEGTVSSRDLYVLKKTYPPAVFLELGNINNSRDRTRLMRSDNRAALSKWIYLGLLADYKSQK